MRARTRPCFFPVRCAWGKTVRFFPVRTEGAQGAPFFPERGAPPAAAARPVWKRPAGLCPEQETVPLPGAGNDPCGLRMGRPCQSRVFCVQNIPSRSVAQHGSAPALGAGGRWFESSRSDHMRSRGHTTMWCDLFCFCGPLVTAPAAGAVYSPWEHGLPFLPGSLCGRAWTGRREPRLQEAPSLASTDRQDGCMAVRAGCFIPLQDGHLCPEQQ